MTCPHGHGEDVACLQCKRAFGGTTVHRVPEWAVVQAADILDNVIASTQPHRAKGADLVEMAALFGEYPPDHPRFRCHPCPRCGPLVTPHECEGES